MARPQKALVVDDLPVNRLILGTILHKLGFEVLEAEHGLQCIDVYTQQRAQVVCIFLDLQMPVADGWAATKGIRDLESQSPSAEQPRVPVVVCTATCLDDLVEGGQTVAQRALSLGADAAVRKPLTTNAVQRILDEYAPRWRSSISGCGNDESTPSGGSGRCSCAAPAGSTSVSGSNAAAAAATRQQGTPGSSTGGAAANSTGFWSRWPDAACSAPLPGRVAAPVAPAVLQPLASGGRCVDPALLCTHCPLSSQPPPWQPLDLQSPSRLPYQGQVAADPWVAGTAGYGGCRAGALSAGLSRHSCVGAGGGAGTVSTAPPAVRPDSGGASSSPVQVLRLSGVCAGLLPAAPAACGSATGAASPLAALWGSCSSGDGVGAGGLARVSSPGCRGAATSGFHALASGRARSGAGAGAGVVATSCISGPCVAAAMQGGAALPGGSGGPVADAPGAGMEGLALGSRQRRVSSDCSAAWMIGSEISPGRQPPAQIPVIVTAAAQ